MEDNAAALPQGEAMTDVNVVYVQLESFFDPQQIKGLEFNQDPLPNWHALQEEYTTGSPHGTGGGSWYPPTQRLKCSQA